MGQKVFPRLRPISLEFSPQNPDYRVVLDQQEPNPDPQQSLSNSIDELLDELDGSHAPSDPGADQSTETEPAQDTSTSETLDALDAVTENTEALIDDAIGELLNEPSPMSLDDSVAEPSAEPDTIAPADSETDSAPANDIAELPEDVLDQIANEESIAANAAVASIEPTAADDTPADDVLDSVNEDLISEIESIAEQSVEPISEAVPETEALPEFEPAVEAPIEEPTHAESTQAEPTQTEPAQSEPVESPEPAPDPTPASSEPESGLGDLDDVLAGIGDDLLMGDFATPEGELVETNTNEDDQAHSLLLESLALDVTSIKSVEAIEASESAAESASTEVSSTDAPEPVQEPVQEAEPVAEAEPTTPPVTETTSEPASESTPEPTPEPDPAPAAQASPTVPATIPGDAPATPESVAKAPTHSPDTSSAPHDVHEELDEDEIRSIWQTAYLIGQAKSKQYGHLIVTRGGPIVAKGLIQLSRPLASKSPEIRNSVGYVAIWTLFLAAILWGYTMFFRTPPTPTPTKAPTRVVTSGDDLEAIENQMPSESP